MLAAIRTALDSSFLRPVATRQARISTALIAGAALVFAAHAASYLYFFVDDEAIALVYARNVLHGEGLVYSVAEGKVEGYSNFLHVMWNTLLIAIMRAASLPRLTALDVGRAVSFGLGISTILLTAVLIRRAGANRPGLVSGVGFLAFAGPLALWSCSSLETVPFAFVLTAFAGALVLDSSSARPTLAIVLGTIALLDRIDGFIYVGVLIAAAFAVADPERRRWLATHAALPLIGIALLYHGMRLVYFGTLLSAPLEAKVLYKLAPSGHAIVKAPDRAYLHGFMDLFGVALVPALALAIVLAWRSRPARAAALAAILMALYVSAVGDWMFGWRFTVPLLPLVALVIAAAVSRVRERFAWAVALGVLVWSASAAVAFGREYVNVEKRPIWWTAPHRGENVWLAPYGDLISTVRTAVTRGETIAYNQAGLLPFVLDVDNIDDLGICSRFEAELPETDVYFTEVGRYSPLMPAPVFNAAHAYLLYRDVRILISRTDLLVKANAGHLPSDLLDGYFHLAALDKLGENAMYTRTEKDASAFRRDPSLFRQNLAHASRIVRLDVDGRSVPGGEITASVPFLRWQTGIVRVHGRTRLDIRFADDDDDVYALYVGALRARGGVVAAMFTLYDAAGKVVAREFAQPDETPAPLLRRFDRAKPARMLSIEAESSDDDADLEITDLRVQGQSAVLRDYVRRKLPFPALTDAARRPSTDIR